MRAGAFWQAGYSGEQCWLGCAHTAEGDDARAAGAYPCYSCGRPSLAGSDCSSNHEAAAVWPRGVDLIGDWAVDRGGPARIVGLCDRQVGSAWIDECTDREWSWCKH